MVNTPHLKKTNPCPDVRILRHKGRKHLYVRDVFIHTFPEGVRDDGIHAWLSTNRAQYQHLLAPS
jgi:hypothetical protein